MRETVLSWAVTAYTTMLPLAWAALAVAVVLLLPMALFNRTRGVAAVGLHLASYVVGVTTWFLGAALTFGAFGWFGLIVGLLIFGVGVVPMGIAGAYFKLDSGPMAASVLGMLVLTFGMRALGLYFAAKTVARQGGERQDRG